MKILIGCECSGIIRNAFQLRGHDAWSCDLKPTEMPGQHLQIDLAAVLTWGCWDMAILHPPCTYLSYAGARWWRQPGMAEKQMEALRFFAMCLDAPIERIAVENPRGLPSKLIRKPDDIIEPYEFGDHAKKRTYLWLKNLPPLMKTYVQLDYQVNWTEAQTRDRAAARSRTFQGIADAMASQWT